MNLLHLFAQTESNCTVNGQATDCGELAKDGATFLGIGIGLLVLIAILTVASLIYWLLMLIHAIRHNSPERTIWIIVLVVSFITGFWLVGAIVYHIAEKPRADASGLVSGAPPQAPQPKSKK